MNIKSKYNWSVSHDIILSITRKELWEIISTANNLNLFHPFCKKNPVLNWPGINSIDEVHYYNGLVYERTFIKWINNVGYDLFIGEKNKIKSFVSWRIHGLGNKSKLTISVYPYIFNMSYKFINYLPFFLFVKPSLKKYLFNIGQGFNYYVQTHKSVTRNQFGFHKWFSN